MCSPPAAILRIGLLEMSSFTLEFFPDASPSTFSHHSAGVADLITTSCMSPFLLLLLPSFRSSPFHHLIVADSLSLFFPPPPPLSSQSVAETENAPRPLSRRASRSRSSRRSSLAARSSRAPSPPTRSTSSSSPGAERRATRCSRRSTRSRLKGSMSRACLRGSKAATRLDGSDFGFLPYSIVSLLPLSFPLFTTWIESIDALPCARLECKDCPYEE
jgi:hypothetical protein